MCLLRSGGIIADFHRLLLFWCRHRVGIVLLKEFSRLRLPVNIESDKGLILSETRTARFDVFE